MSDVKLVTAESWDSDVEKSDKLVLVQFSAAGCMPCNTLRPRLASLAEQRKDSLIVAEVKIDKSPELAEKFSIRAVPSLKVFKGGQIVAEHAGLLSKNDLDSFVDSVKDDSHA